MRLNVHRVAHLSYLWRGSGAGNSCTLPAALLARQLVESFGWQAVFGVACISVAAGFTFALFAKNAPKAAGRRSPANFLAQFKEGDTGLFRFFSSAERWRTPRNSSPGSKREPASVSAELSVL